MNSAASKWTRTVLERQNIEPMFAKELVSALANEWNCREPEFIRWFDNVVYRAKRDDSVVYLRLTQTTRRSRAQIESELELLGFLADRAFASTRPVPTRAGAKSLQRQHGGETLVACAFTECGGTLFESVPPSDLGEFCRSAHGDFTVKNMHYHEAGVSLFDFDCCCEHWYAYDIACFLHFFSQYPKELRRVVYEHTLAGYAEASDLSQQMVEQIPNFGRMKLLRGFLVYAMYFGLENSSPALREALISRRRLLREPPV